MDYGESQMGLAAVKVDKNKKTNTINQSGKEKKMKKQRKCLS